MSPCTLIEPLRWEVGEEIRYYQDEMIWALQTESKSLGNYTKRFARALGCLPEANELFQKRIVEHQREIFDIDYNSSRGSIVGATRRLVRADPELKYYCDGFSTLLEAKDKIAQDRGRAVSPPSVAP